MAVKKLEIEFVENNLNTEKELDVKIIAELYYEILESFKRSSHV